MKGVHFYREPSRERSVIAIILSSKRYDGDIFYDCIAGVLPVSNPMPASSCVCGQHLRDCYRISEAEARRVHPNLFTMLDPKE